MYICPLQILRAMCSYERLFRLKIVTGGGFLTRGTHYGTIITRVIRRGGSVCVYCCVTISSKYCSATRDSTLEIGSHVRLKFARKLLKHIETFEKNRYILVCAEFGVRHVLPGILTNLSPAPETIVC